MTAGTPLRVSPARQGSTEVLALVGELDLASRKVVIDAVTEALGDGTVAAIRLDLSALTFLDCSGIGALVTARTQAEEKGVRVTLSGATGMPLRLLRMTELIEAEHTTPA
ncbi:MAG TPA: STAS domain-containing protein [Micromonosporaceae bacterium]|jgi:anti-anti-sigma factor